VVDFGVSGAVGLYYQLFLYQHAISTYVFCVFRMCIAGPRGSAAANH